MCMSFLACWTAAQKSTAIPLVRSHCTILGSRLRLCLPILLSAMGLQILLNFAQNVWGFFLITVKTALCHLPPFQDYLAKMFLKFVIQYWPPVLGGQQKCNLQLVFLWKYDSFQGMSKKQYTVSVVTCKSKIKEFFQTSVSLCFCASCPYFLKWTGILSRILCTFFKRACF